MKVNKVTATRISFTHVEVIAALGKQYPDSGLLALQGKQAFTLSAHGNSNDPDNGSDIENVELLTIEYKTAKNS